MTSWSAWSGSGYRSSRDVRDLRQADRGVRRLRRRGVRAPLLLPLPGEGRRSVGPRAPRPRRL